jgi:hypothetical protein
VVVLAVLGIGAFLVLGGGDDDGGGGGSGPESAVKSFFNAAAKGDCEGMINRISDSSFAGATKESAISECKDALSNGETLFDGEDASLDSVKLKDQDGDKATVTVVSTTDGKKETEDVQVVKEDGTWKIDFTALTATSTIGGDDDTGDDDTTDTSFDPTDTSIDLGDFDLPEECQDPTSPDFDYEACADALGSGG